jgi:hypothetical protein
MADKSSRHELSENCDAPVLKTTHLIRTFEVGTCSCSKPFALIIWLLVVCEVAVGLNVGSLAGRLRVASDARTPFCPISLISTTPRAFSYNNDSYPPMRL